MSDPSHAKALSSIQTCGNPRSALLAALETDDKELQLVALSCLAAFFQNLVDSAFLHDADEQVATARCFKFATHSERRFHGPVLSIVESISHYGTSVAGRRVCVGGSHRSVSLSLTLT